MQRKRKFSFAGKQKPCGLKNKEKPTGSTGSLQEAQEAYRKHRKPTGSIGSLQEA
jgi:hypothetical protein